MKEFENRNPLRHQAEKAVLEQDMPASSDGRRHFLRDFLFLFILVCFLGGIVRHYSRFSTDGKFLLQTEDSGIISDISDHQEEIEFQRLLIRNRYPFELTVTIRLCHMEGDMASPRFSIIERQHCSFTGVRSLYSGSFETRITIVASGDGRFYVTDRSGKPEELLNMAADRTSEQNIEEVDVKLRASLTNQVREGQLPGISTIREDQMTNHGKEIIKYCSLPGEHPDKILVITLTPKVNDGR